MQPDAPYQPQPQPQPTPPAEPTYQQQTPPAHNPGKTLGIVGFVFAFVGLHAIGLILSIIGLVKSKKAGFNNGLAIAGIILNAVFMILTILIVFVTVVSYANIADRGNTVAARSAALKAVTEVVSYASEHNGVYPVNRADLPHSTTNYQATPLLGEPSDPTAVALYTCGDEGNAVEYWDYNAGKAVLEFTDASLTISDCTLLED